MNQQRHTNEDTLTDIFGSEEMRNPAPTEFIPKGKTSPEIAYQLVKDETYPQFSYMLYILLQKDFYYSVFSGICQELILHILQISAFNSSGELISYGWLFNRIVE